MIQDIPIHVEPFSIFEEVYEEFQHYDGPELTGKQVVDIGAHYGSLSWLAAERGAHVIALEPFYYPQLCKNIDQSVGRDRVVPLPFAVSRVTGRSVTLRAGKGPGSPSLILNHAETIEKKYVPLVSFFDLLEISGPPDYLKCDCEGGEYTFLIPSDKCREALEKIAYLHIEIHGCEEFSYYYSDEFLSKQYFNADRKDQVLVDFLADIFDLKEVRSNSRKRVFMGPRKRDV